MRTFGLIGYPLSHSFSQKYFTDKFAAEGIVDQYLNFPIASIEEVTSLIESTPSLLGLNVTIPYKTQVIQYISELDEVAAKVKAVNCILIEGDKKKLYGYNTDVYGFLQSIKPFLESHHTRALILGKGGAALAVAYCLKQLNIDYFFVSREAVNKNNTISYREVNKQVITSSPLIINCTPLGMFPAVDSCPPIPYEHLTDKHFLYDLIYNPAETLFLQKGRSAGAIVLNGLSMLQLQADKSWEIWNKN